MSQYIGKPVNRVDGPLKVKGEAMYTADHHVPGMLYGFVVSSPYSKGEIQEIYTEKAKAVPGVVDVLFHENRPSLAWFNKKYNDDDAPTGDHFRPLYDNQILHSGQPVALVVADSLETARYASRLVRVTAKLDAIQTELKAQTPEKVKNGKSGWERPKSRGHAEKEFQAGATKIQAPYSTAVNHHNPMEMHATVAIYEGEDKFTVFDKTQGVMNSHTYLCNVFGLKPENLHLRSEFVGGAFGSGLRPQYQSVLAVMAAMHLKKSVKVVLTRQQMFTFGYRPATTQEVKLSAQNDGTLSSITHTTVTGASRFEEYVDKVVNWSGSAYQCENVELDHKIAKLDLHTPIDMRAPGAAVGVFALESAMDELALELKMDPIELRLKNHADSDQEHFGRPHSSKELKKCYELGAKAFGWQPSNPPPRSRQEGPQLIGQGMAGAIWEAGRMGGSAYARIHSSGRLEVGTATSDMGTGTYTVMSQVGAEEMGMHLKDVHAVLGDSKLPPSPLSGGSWTAASVSTVLSLACQDLKEKLFKQAQKMEGHPFGGDKIEDVEFKEACLISKTNRLLRVPYTKLVAAAGKDFLEGQGSENMMLNMVKGLPYSKHTYGAIFAEVKVDMDFGMIEVSRIVGAIAAGKILNPKTARSQILGGLVWGVSQALHEESHIDHRYGRFMNHSFAEYHISVAKDIGDMEVIFVPDEDKIVSPLGIKGLGEIGIVGTAAAIANAVYNATGVRVRDLPITPDKLI